jgi:tetratricopeptide (TPR) repeat protein
MRGTQHGRSIGEPLKIVRQSSRVSLWLGCPVLASRYAHWRLTCALSRMWALCVRIARSPVTETVVVVVILWQGPPLYKAVTGRSISWEILAALLALAAFITLLGRSRRRTVFQDFPDCTSPEASGAVPGLGAYLANEVDRLGALYRRVQRERQVTKGSDRLDDAIQPIVELDGTAEFLKDAVSPDAKLSLGPVSIPLGSILGLVARLMKGPQITGSLHREGDRLVLLAHYEGAQPKSWRVEGPPGSGETDEKGRWNLHPLVEEMAKRMLCDLTFGGRVNPRAIDAFTRAARASLEEAGLARPPLLRQLDVRNCLLEAIAEDDSFDLAWYNLGVTLLALDDKEMARSVFMRARSGNPDRWEATYALAVLPGPVASRMVLCNQVIGTSPGPGAEARAYDLLGLLYTEGSSHVASEAWEFNKLAVASRRLAAQRAWRALRRAEWSARTRKETAQLDSARRLVLNCLTNLAICYKTEAEIQAVAQELRRATGVAAGLEKQARLMRQKSWANGKSFSAIGLFFLGGSVSDWKRRRIARQDLRRRKRAMSRVRRPVRQVELLLREAEKIGPLDPRAHQELGALNEELGNWGRAAEQYARALEVTIDDPSAWVCLACAGAKTRRNRLLSSQAARALFALAPLAQPGQLNLVAAAIKEFDPETSDQLRLQASLDGQIGQAIAGAKRGDRQALIQLDKLTQETRLLPNAAWAHYRCASAGFRFGPPSAPMAPDPARVGELLEAAERLDKECAPAVRRKNIHLSVAKALASRGQVAAALDHADKATQTAPFSPWAWQTLGDLLRRRTELDTAEKCYLDGLQWITKNEQLVALTLSLTFCRLSRLQGKSGDQSGDSGLLDASRRLKEILSLLKPGATWQRIKVYYWLGLVAFALDDCQEAIVDFSIAAKLAGSDIRSTFGDVSIVALSQEARALMKAGQLDEARSVFDGVVNAITGRESDQKALKGTANIGPGGSPTFGEVLIDARLGGASARVMQGEDLASARQLIELCSQQLPTIAEEKRKHYAASLEGLLKQINSVESP